MNRAEKTVENAREIARQLGESKTCFVCGLLTNMDALVYKDEYVEIRKRGRDLEIVYPHSPGGSPGKFISNPVVMVTDDKIIRYHGETRYIENYIDLLAEGLYSSCII